MSMCAADNASTVRRTTLRAHLNENRVGRSGHLGRDSPRSISVSHFPEVFSHPDKGKELTKKKKIPDL